MPANSAPTPAGLQSPLPSRQHRLFRHVFHAIFLIALGDSLYLHWRYVGGKSPSNDLWLGSLVAAQTVLYVYVFALDRQRHLHRWRWITGIAVSVVLVLLESRIDPGFVWSLVMYVAWVAVFPLRFSLPAAVTIFALHFPLRFGSAALASWGPEAWLSNLLKTLPLFAMAFFMGAALAMSARRGRLVLQLAAAKRELEQARERELEVAALRERERLARDLHDALGHSLVTLTVQLEAVQRLLPTDPARATELLTTMQGLTRSSTEDLRRSLANLRARGLDDRPLTTALQTLCTEAGQQFAGPMECHIAPGADALPAAVAEVLWRVAQEGLTNIEKHARADHAALHLLLPPKSVVLRMSDNGVGLPANAEARPGHYGLRGLRERVEGIGGTFTLRTTDSGTVIEAQVPVIA